MDMYFSGSATLTDYKETKLAKSVFQCGNPLLLYRVFTKNVIKNSIHAGAKVGLSA